MSDLDRLIAEAEREQHARKSKSRVRSSAAETFGAQFKKVGKWVSAAAALVIVLVIVGLWAKPISEEVIRSDLDRVLNAAQSAVEAYAAENKALPDRVPLAALSNLVALESTDVGYRLRLSMNGMTRVRDLPLPVGVSK